MVMAVEVPESVDRDAARAALAPLATEMGLEIWVGESGAAAPAIVGERCVVSVYGADHPGIVHAVSQALADAGVNIVDLSSRVVGDPPVYVLGIEAELPAGLSVDALQGRLHPVADAQHVELHIEREADEVL
jgi:glycine cleavage system transcriptional repressor